MYCRIVRTSLDAPIRLAENEARKFVMVFGPSGLKRIEGKNSMEAMVELGHAPRSIRRELRRGKKFFLVTFERPAVLYRATWSGVIEACADFYPEFANAFHAALADLRKYPLAHFEAQAGDFSFADVHANGADDERFYTPERFAASAQTPADVRRFLFNVLHLNELFTGDGRTLRHDGEQGVREYVTPNVDIAALKNVGVVPLDC
jgi:hypothetical protein